MNRNFLIISSGILLILSGTFSIFSIITVLYMSGYLLAFELTEIGQRILMIFCLLQIITMTIISLTYLVFKSKVLLLGSTLTIIAFTLLLLEKTFTPINIGFVLLSLILLSTGFSGISHVLNSRLLDIASILLILVLPIGELLCGILLIYFRKRIEIHFTLLRKIGKS